MVIKKENDVWEACPAMQNVVEVKSSTNSRAMKRERTYFSFVSRQVIPSCLASTWDLIKIAYVHIMILISQRKVVGVMLNGIAYHMLDWMANMGFFSGFKKIKILIWFDCWQWQKLGITQWFLPLCL